MSNFQISYSMFDAFMLHYCTSEGQQGSTAVIRVIHGNVQFGPQEGT